jgi:Glyoxalase-like domain
MLYAFDHIVIIARDKIFPVAQRLANLGFQLTPMAKHNLGSCNQLVMLSNAYVEVLGWEEGTVPQRKEIADLPMGLDALVFRTYNATECYEKLQKSSFDVNPVQKLSRSAQVHGEEKLAQFNTVRFQTQPIPGLRIYFCEHLTPEFLWFDEVLKHPNLCDFLSEISVETPLLKQTSAIFLKLLELSDKDIHFSKDQITLHLANCSLTLRENKTLSSTKIVDVLLKHQPSDIQSDSSNDEITLTNQICDSL